MTEEVLSAINIPSDIPANCPAPTFEDVFSYSIRSFSGQEFLEFYASEEKIVLGPAEYARAVENIAAKLAEKCAGLPKNSWVGFKQINHPFWFAVFFAILRSGYKVLLLDPDCESALLDFYLMQARAGALVTSAVPCEDADDESTGGTEKEGNRPVEYLYRLIDFDELVGKASSHPLQATVTDAIYEGPWADKIAFCTSGTTSTAQVIVFSAQGVLATIRNGSGYFRDSPTVCATLVDGERHLSKVLVTLPMRHVFGFTVPLAFWAIGHPMVFPKNNSIMELFESVKREGIWMTYGVPAIWKALYRIARSQQGGLDATALTQAFGKQFKMGLTGGSRTDQTMRNELLKAGFCLCNAYGSTESHGCICLGPGPEEPDIHAEGEFAGVLYNGHVAKLVAPDGSVVSESVGELAICGEALYCATLQDGEEVPALVETGGWYHTGDLFRIENGLFYYQGRCKNVIINEAGENIYPEELWEHFRYLEDEAGHFAVIGLDDEPVLIINPYDLTDFDQNKIMERIEQNNAALPLYKRLTRIIVARNPLPLTSKGDVRVVSVLDDLAKHKDNFYEKILKGRKKQDETSLG
jgi:acyl-CoA synthetase (AMP-forming)/AMP-acid ligase II